MGAQPRRRHVFSTDLPTIETEIRSFRETAAQAERTNGNAILEIGKRLVFVKSNDLIHGDWLSWLSSIGIEHRTAQRYMQAYEQFGNTSCASHLTAGIMFDLLSLPDSINREAFLTNPQRVPSSDVMKLVTEMSQQERREVVKHARESAGLRVAKAAPKTDEAPRVSGNSNVDVWALLDAKTGELNEKERETLYSLPIDLVKRILSESADIQKIALDVAGRLSYRRFLDKYDDILASAKEGKSAAFIWIAHMRKTDAKVWSLAHVDECEILGVSVTENEQVVRKRYRTLMTKIHPDVGGSDFLFKLVKDAYDRFLEYR